MEKKVTEGYGLFDYLLTQVGLNTYLTKRDIKRGVGRWIKAGMDKTLAEKHEESMKDATADLRIQFQKSVNRYEERYEDILKQLKESRQAERELRGEMIELKNVASTSSYALEDATTQNRILEAKIQQLHNEIAIATRALRSSNADYEKILQEHDDVKSELKRLKNHPFVKLFGKFFDIGD